MVRVNSLFVTLPSGGYIHVGEGSSLPFINPYSKGSRFYSSYCLVAVVGPVHWDVVFYQAQEATAVAISFVSDGGVAMKNRKFGAGLILRFLNQCDVNVFFFEAFVELRPFR